MYNTCFHSAAMYCRGQPQLLAGERLTENNYGAVISKRYKTISRVHNIIDMISRYIYHALASFTRPCRFAGHK